MEHELADALEILSAHTGTVEILSDARHDLLGGTDACFSFDLRYTVHAPTTDINIASCRQPIRQASLDLLRGVCREAGRIDAGCVVVHPGFSPWLEMLDRSYEALVASLRELAAVQEEYGVPVAIENMGTWEVCHFRDPSLLPVLEEEGLSFCLDVGHAHVNGLLEEFLAAGRPSHIHLHDNRGSCDDHLALGAGCIDFSPVFPRLPCEVAWIIEVQELEAFDESARFMGETGQERITHMDGEKR
jgi:sugar phosphate isomerase/epimerase